MKRLRDLTAVLGMVALTACNNASIEGSWVEPVPGMSGMQQGYFQVPASAITRIFLLRIR